MRTREDIEKELDYIAIKYGNTRFGNAKMIKVSVGFLLDIRDLLTKKG